MLIELALEMGLLPKKTSSTHGGEYHSSCPSCGGSDRFFIQPNRQMKSSVGYYQCRRCEKRGDSIQFCRDFMGLSYLEACAKIGQKPRELSSCFQFLSKPTFIPKDTILPSQQWLNRASEFVISSHQNALNSPTAIRLLKERGFTSDTIEKYQIGWNGLNRYDAANLWGIYPFGKKNSKSIWLPKGIVIPSFFEGQVMKLKIRRSDIEPGDTRKYIIQPGGRNSPSFFGKVAQQPIIILESELDAILLQQIAGDLCNCMSIPAGNRPDDWADRILRSASQLIFSMDFDEAGSRTITFWKSAYPKIKIWPVPRGKSPGDAFTKGVDLRHWIESGLKVFQFERF